MFEKFTNIWTGFTHMIVIVDGAVMARRAGRCCWWMRNNVTMMNLENLNRDEINMFFFFNNIATLLLVLVLITRSSHLLHSSSPICNFWLITANKLQLSHEKCFSKTNHGNTYDQFGGSMITVLTCASQKREAAVDVLRIVKLKNFYDSSSLSGSDSLTQKN